MNPKTHQGVYIVRQPAELILTDKDGTVTNIFRILEIQLNVFWDIIQVKRTPQGIFYNGIWFSDWDTYLAKRIHESFLFAAFSAVWIDESGKGDSVDINLDNTFSFQVKQVLIKNDHWDNILRRRGEIEHSDNFQTKLLEKKIRIIN